MCVCVCVCVWFFRARVCVYSSVCAFFSSLILIGLINLLHALLVYKERLIRNASWNFWNFKERPCTITSRSFSTKERQCFRKAPRIFYNYLLDFFHENMHNKLGIMIHRVEIIVDFILETLQYSTAAFEVRPIQLIAITREILQRLEFQFLWYRRKSKVI